MRDKNPEKNPPSLTRTKLQPTYDTGPELNSGHIGWRRALSPLRHLHLSLKQNFFLKVILLTRNNQSCDANFATWTTQAGLHAFLHPRNTRGVIIHARTERDYYSPLSLYPSVNRTREMARVIRQLCYEHEMRSF